MNHKANKIRMIM